MQGCGLNFDDMLLLSQTEEPRTRIADYPPRKGLGRGRKKTRGFVEGLGAYGLPKKQETDDAKGSKYDEYHRV